MEKLLEQLGAGNKNVTVYVHGLDAGMTGSVQYVDDGILVLGGDTYIRIKHISAIVEVDQ